MLPHASPLPHSPTQSQRSTRTHARSRSARRKRTGGTGLFAAAFGHPVFVGLGKYNLQVYVLQAAFASICNFHPAIVATNGAYKTATGIVLKPVEATTCWLLGLWLFAGVFTEIFEVPIIRAVRWQLRPSLRSNRSVCGERAQVVLRSTIIRVDHLCCGMESKMIRDMLAPLTTVEDVKISLTDRRVNVEHSDELAPETLVEMFNAKHLGASLQDKALVETVGSSFNVKELVRLGTNSAQIALFVVLLAFNAFGYQRVATWLGWVCVVLSVALFNEAYLAVRRLTPNVELLMAIAMLGALVQGDVVEAASVGALVTLMDLVKVFALEAVERKLRGSVVTEPLQIDTPGGGKVALSDLKVGDMYVLRVGDVVPADGLVTSGNATLDESRVTGEALPQTKRKGDKVSSGSLVAMGFVQVQAEVPVSASFQARVTDSVAEAKSTLSETEAIVSKFATWYTPTILVLAVALGIYKGFEQFLVVIVAGCPCALLGAAPFVQGATLSLLAGRHRLLVKRATTLESLARIRAVGLDKTGTLTTGQFELLRMEPVTQLPKETLHRWTAAVEEKDPHPLARSLVASYKGCIGDFVASGDTLPEVTGFKRHGRDGVSATVDGHLVGVGNVAFVQTTTGVDLSAHEEAATSHSHDHGHAEKQTDHGHDHGDGCCDHDHGHDHGDGCCDHDHGHDHGDGCCDHDHSHAEKPASHGHNHGGSAPVSPQRAITGVARARDLAADWDREGTVLFVTVDSQIAAVLLLDDAIKTEAASTVAALADLGVRSVLLTGDRLPAAKRVARAVGISEANTHAGLLPEDKQRHILDLTWQGSESHKGTRDLEASFLPKSKLRGPIEVGFVGDGLNDCPALASAHVGIVLQEIGSQATVDAASAVLQVDIDQLPAAIVIARRSRLLLITNICLALAMNVLIVLLAATVGLPLWLSVLSDSGSLLVILANSLWPLTWRVGKDARRQRSNS